MYSRGRYTRIKMLAKMRDKLPILARAPRPEGPTPEELELQKRLVEEEQAYLLKVLKVRRSGLPSLNCVSTVNTSRNIDDNRKSIESIE